MIVRLILILAAAAVISLTGCTRFDLINAPISSGGYLRTTDIPYGPLPRQKLDIYRPRNAAPDTPVVVFFYGGGWDSGEKGGYRFAAEALTSRGFIAVLPDYRLYPDVTFPTFVEDGALAVRWAHDNVSKFGGDPQHLYLMGHSAGAHIAALLTLDPLYLKSAGLDRSAIRATAGLSGPYDFIPRPVDLPVFRMNPGDLAPADTQPIHFVDGKAPPMLLIQGLGDTVIDPRNSARLAAAIESAGGQVQYIPYEGVGHATVVISLAWPFRWLAPTLRDATAFFRAH